MDQPADPRVSDIVRSGTIRIALFLPQYVEDPATGEPMGRGTGIMATEITRELAARLGVGMRIVRYPTPVAAVEGLVTGMSDLAFLGIEPSRAKVVDYSPPIFEFDYTFLVPAGSTISSAADADRPGIRIAVVNNHASTLALRGLVKHAELVEFDLPDAAFGALRDGRVDTAAFPRDVLVDYSAKLPGSRVLADAYGVNRIGIAVAKDRPGWLAYLREFVAVAKATGLVRRAIDDGRLPDFRVAADTNSSAP